MNSDKAYLLGLVIGGGIFGNTENTLMVKLPYKKWGSYIREPERAGEIAKDILKVVSPMFRTIYGLNISYQTNESGTWNIFCEGDLAALIDDLNHYDISPVGDIKRNVSIEKVVAELVDDNLKRRFVAGLGDTIGSLTPSHRRFTDDNQIVSFEIPGMCFDFVCQLCRLLYSIKCYPDQVLWNHPNFHAGNNPYYKQWRKGFKVRVKLDQYAKFGAFAFKTKVESSAENLELQEGTPSYSEPCEYHRISATYSCVHPDENSHHLPTKIRGGHFVHHKHVCAVLGCEHTPYDEIRRLLDESKECISPFPIIVKGSTKDIEDIINKAPLLKNRKYRIQNIDLKKLYKMYKNNAYTLVFGDKKTTGYPLNEIMQGIAFLVSAHIGNLHGNRPKGNFINIIETALSSSTMTFYFRIPDLLTPLIMSDESYAVLIGARNPAVYKKLISFDEKNPYKIIVRNILEDDLK